MFLFKQSLFLFWKKTYLLLEYFWNLYSFRVPNLITFRENWVFSSRKNTGWFEVLLIFWGSWLPGKSDYFLTALCFARKIFVLSRYLGDFSDKNSHVFWSVVLPNNFYHTKYHKYHSLSFSNYSKFLKTNQ